MVLFHRVIPQGARHTFDWGVDMWWIFFERGIGFLIPHERGLLERMEDAGTKVHATRGPARLFAPYGPYMVWMAQARRVRACCVDLHQFCINFDGRICNLVLHLIFDHSWIHVESMSSAEGQALAGAGKNSVWNIGAKFLGHRSKPQGDFF